MTITSAIPTATPAAPSLAEHAAAVLAGTGLGLGDAEAIARGDADPIPATVAGMTGMAGPALPPLALDALRAGWSAPETTAAPTDPAADPQGAPR